MSSVLTPNHELCFSTLDPDTRTQLLDLLDLSTLDDSIVLLAAPALVRILGTCPEATVQTLDRSEALGSLAQAIRVQQRDGLPPDLWLPEAPPPVRFTPEHLFGDGEFSVLQRLTMRFAPRICTHDEALTLQSWAVSVLWRLRALLPQCPCLMWTGLKRHSRHPSTGVPLDLPASLPGGSGHAP